MPWSYPGSTPGIDPRSQEVIPKRFKRKKIFVTDAGRRTDGQTDRRVSRNSDVDGSSETLCSSFERSNQCAIGATKLKGVAVLFLCATPS